MGKILYGCKTDFPYGIGYPIKVNFDDNLKQQKDLFMGLLQEALSGSRLEISMLNVKVFMLQPNGKKGNRHGDMSAEVYLAPGFKLRSGGHFVTQLEARIKSLIKAYPKGSCLDHFTVNVQVIRTEWEDNLIIKGRAKKFATNPPPSKWIVEVGWETWG